MRSHEVRMVMRSDWQVGTGTGRRGQVNQLVARDGDGLPYLRGGAFAALWRDSCEVAAHALDGGRGGWHDWVEFLFGSQPAQTEPADLDAATHAPGPAVVRQTPLRLHPDVRAALRGRVALVQATTFLRYRNRIDRPSGTTEDKGVFVEEMARTGLVLYGAVELDGFDELTGEQQSCAVALLGVGVRLLERVGGGRRRGSGNCTVQISGMEPDLDWLDRVPQPPAPPQQLTGRAAPLAPPVASGPGWERVRLRLRLRQPLIVGERVVGNEVRSADHVPGSVLLPAVLRALDSDAAHAAARAGQLVVTNASPAVGDGAGRPAPDVLVRHKTDPGWWANLAVEARPAKMSPRPLRGYLGELPVTTTSIITVRPST